MYLIRNFIDSGFLLILGLFRFVEMGFNFYFQYDSLILIKMLVLLEVFLLILEKNVLMI